MKSTTLTVSTNNTPVYSRRKFSQQLVTVGVFTGLTAGLSSGTLAQGQQTLTSAAVSSTPSTARATRILTRSQFQPRLSDYFQATDDFGAPVSLLLLQINDLPELKKRLAQKLLTAKEANTLSEESFALIFRGPRTLPLRQRIYKLKHPLMGEIEIFLVPVGKVNAEDAGRDYEAVFNRLLS